MSSDKKRQAICSRVCDLLREERVRRGFSMTALAQKSGLSQQAVSYVEREMRTPNLDTLLRICDALGIALDNLIRRASEEARTK